MTVHAVYEKGLTEKVNLSDLCEVEVDVREIKATSKSPALEDIYAILSRRFNSGEHDAAAHHNEHQPCSQYFLAPLA